jgi:hypothetical protein
LSDDKTVVLSDTIRIPGAVTPDTGVLSVSSLDVFEMLQKGSLLNDNVVQGYINLLGSAFGSSHGVQVVNTNFFKYLESAGWDKVSRWMQSSEVMESNWDTAPIILVPIFTGHNKSGHWSNLLRLGTSIKCTIYDDSLEEQTARENAEKVRKEIDSTPLLHDRIHWSVARSPVQIGDGNACGVYTALKCAALLKAFADGRLFIIDKNAQTYIATCQMVGDVSVAKFEESGRLHILESLCQGSINLDHPAIATLELRIRGPTALL